MRVVKKIVERVYLFFGVGELGERRIHIALLFEIALNVHRNAVKGAFFVGASELLLGELGELLANARFVFQLLHLRLALRTCSASRLGSLFDDPDGKNRNRNECDSQIPILL